MATLVPLPRAMRGRFSSAISRVLGSVVATSDANGKPGRAFEALALVKALRCVPEARSATVLRRSRHCHRHEIAYRLKTTAGSIRTTLNMALTAATTHMPIVSTNRLHTRLNVITMG